VSVCAVCAAFYVLLFSVRTCVLSPVSCVLCTVYVYCFFLCAVYCELYYVLRMCTVFCVLCTVSCAVCCVLCAVCCCVPQGPHISAPVIGRAGQDFRRHIQRCTHLTCACAVCCVLCTVCWVLGAGCWVLGAGCWVLGAVCLLYVWCLLSCVLSGVRCGGVLCTVCVLCVVCFVLYRVRSV
jgi:hypothetical protein